MAKTKTKKNKELKQNSFLNGAFIATMGIVGSKVLGILYVIPFYAIIGGQGGALYGYAYTIYNLFQSLSCAGIPYAISKIISEYQTLGYYNAKERAFKLGRKIVVILGIIIFLILFIFAPNIAEAIIGDLEGGNSLEDVTMVVRVISTAILIVPSLSIYRGYLEGHKFITPPSISQVLEQLVRVIIIVLGSYLAINVFNLSLQTGVGIAVFGATAGAIFAYFYLLDKVRKNKKQLKAKPLKVDEPLIKTKEILIKIFWYSLPFIMIDIFKSCYDFIDMTTLVKTLANDVGYTTLQAENIMSVISTWGNKINMIIVAISTGIIISLIPNLTSSSVKGDKKDVHHKINQTLQVLLFISVPMTLGLSFLSEPVWEVFYGNNSEYGAVILKYFVFVGLIISTYTSLVSIVQVLKYYKEVFISLVVGVVLKLVLNVPLINLFNNLGLVPVYGSITATILGYVVGIILCLIFLRRKCGVSYMPTLKLLGKILIADIAMIVVLLLVKLVIPIYTSSRLLNVPIIVIYSVIGAATYFFIAHKFKLIDEIFGSELVNKIMSKLRRKKHD
ncbi:MAG TPA: polysaccharide biosynthesis protein [Candidatus Onthousia faecipullorum]|uniref:Polysaccharide biosynthesis protein n=1 Tax=Candidatus Onthousia faecipullorum TaxID=2840887 RepID=A0A9D1GB06_9FIRM|nr:polysaccharide biosynthesis protein [Candidatus Onthousia faecipullorum]